MWFATQDGLNRFDGYDFEVFSTDSETGLLENFVWGITEDSNGNIWVASRFGATRLKVDEGTSTHFIIGSDFENLEQPVRQVHQIQQVGDSMMVYFGRFSVLIGLDEGGRDEVVVGGRVLQENDRSRNWFNSLIKTVTKNEKRFFFHLDHVRLDESVIAFPGNHIITTVHQPILELEDRFLIGTNNGLLCLNQSLTVTKIPCISGQVTDIIEVEDNIWVTTFSGIHIIDKEGLRCMQHISRGDGLTDDEIYSIHQSTDGLIWIGTGNQGLNIYDPSFERFEGLNRDLGLSEVAVWVLEENKSGLYLGTSNGLHFQMASGGSKSLLAEKKITALECHDDKVFVGTSEGEIWLIAENDTKLLGKVSLMAITDLEMVGSSLWIASHLGLFRMDENTEDFERMDDLLGIRTTYFLSLHPDPDGSLWAGGNKGFHKIDTSNSVLDYLYQTSRSDLGPANQFITGFLLDKKNRLWVSTYGGGVSILDRSSGRFSHIGKNDGLSNNSCAGILGTESGIWVSHNSGLSRIDPETFEASNFNSNDGLLSDEFVVGSALISASGHLIFGSVSGAVQFDPEDFDMPVPLTSPSITGISINYKKAKREWDSGLLIYPGERTFSLEFSQLSFRKRADVNYEYTLAGFDEGWVRVGSSSRLATYSLRPGKYTFRIRTVLDERKSEPTELLISVLPAFYQTTWFMLVVISFGVLMVVGLVRFFSYRQFRAKLRQMEIQQKIQDERERISRDLHDNIGSQITYIASTLDHLGKEPNQDQMEELSEYTRDTMRQLRDTIWVINKDEISLIELRDKITGFLYEMLKNRRDIRSEIQEDATDVMLNPDKAINLFRIIQEAINNAIKHARPSEITVNIYSTDRGLNVQVRDDGVGFEDSLSSGHFGIVNMRSRAKELGAEFRVESESGRGTMIQINGIK